MTDSDEESSCSENNWPMNEDWIMGILKGDDNSDVKPKINVIYCLNIFFHLNGIDEPQYVRDFVLFISVFQCQINIATRYQ